MLKKVKIVTILAFAVLAGLSSCIQFQNYPIEPHIKFVSFTKIPTTSGVDDKGTLLFSFTDGDGDLGLDDTQTDPPYDTASIYYYNIFIRYYEKQNGEYNEVVLTPSNNGRYPNLTPDGSKKGIQGNKIAVDGEFYPSEMAKAKEVLPGIEWVNVGEDLLDMRIVKTPEELALWRRAYVYFDRAHAFARVGQFAFLGA